MNDITDALGPAEVTVNDVRYVREATLFTAMERHDKFLQALIAIHDYHCGCAHPGDLHICVCQPVVVFGVLRDA